MSITKVLIFLNEKKKCFSVKALSGKNYGKVIKHVEEIIVKDCKFSHNKRKKAGIIGLWDNSSENPEKIIKKYIGAENIDGYYPNHVVEKIAYDYDLQKYIEKTTDEIMEMENYGIAPVVDEDINFKRDAFDNAELIHLWIEYDEDEDSFPDIYGYAYYKRKSSKPDSGVDDDIYSRVSGDISELINNGKCKRCEGEGVIRMVCKHCEGNPEEICGTGCSVCGGDGYEEIRCPICGGKEYYEDG